MLAQRSLSQHQLVGAHAFDAAGLCTRFDEAQTEAFSKCQLIGQRRQTLAIKLELRKKQLVRAVAVAQEQTAREHSARVSGSQTGLLSN